MPVVDLEQMPPDDQKALRAMVDAAYKHADKVRAERRVADITDAELLRRVVQNIVRSRPRRQEFAWAAVREHFGLGSTYSAQLCRRFGLDPDTGADLKTPNASLTGRRRRSG